jgi:hypothetical protein
LGLTGVGFGTTVNYDGLVFHPIDAEPVDGKITTGRYHQNGELVWAEITGPKVRIGRLVGSVSAQGVISASYSQVMADGGIVAGLVVSTPTTLPDGRVRLAENWRRIDGSSGVSYIDSEA